MKMSGVSEKRLGLVMEILDEMGIEYEKRDWAVVIKSPVSSENSVYFQWHIYGGRWGRGGYEVITGTVGYVEVKKRRWVKVEDPKFREKFKDMVTDLLNIQKEYDEYAVRKKKLEDRFAEFVKQRFGHLGDKVSWHKDGYKFKVYIDFGLYNTVTIEYLVKKDGFKPSLAKMSVDDPTDDVIDNMISYFAKEE